MSQPFVSEDMKQILPDQTTGTSGNLTTNTAANQLAAAMASPHTITGKAPEDDTTQDVVLTRGVANPYGMGISAFEPNTTPYITQVAGSKTALGAVGPSDLGSAYASASGDVSTAAAKDAAATGNVAANTIAALGDYAGGGIVNATGKVSGLVAAALSLAAKNTPYVWGGTTANGVDCSGLLYYAAQSAGIKDWKRYVASDYGKMGTQVAMADARPGDVVYYDDPGPTDHVGIYLGNGQMVAAPQTGENVKVQAVYGKPTIRRIFTDDQFSASAQPGGSTTYAYNGKAYVPYGGTAGALKVSVPYANLFTAAASKYGVPAALLAGVAKTESGFNPTAKSPVGAQGLMQFMPGTAKGLGVNALDPASAVDGAGRMLANLHKQFGSWDLALAAYNAGPGAVQKAGGIPKITETQNYVQRVTAAARLYGG